MENTIVIYHGSHEIVTKPTYGKGNRNNDYGLGFYCTEQIDLAKEWACDALLGGYANQYRLNTTGLRILDLNGSDYCILHWISVLLKNRKVTLSSDIEVDAMSYILEHFPVDTESYDIIRGYRADDSYFSYARDFLSNTITVQRLSHAMKLGNLGDQIVLKSKLAFSRLEFLGYEEAQQTTYYPLRKTRDTLARTYYFSNRKEGGIDPNGLFAIDIIRGGIQAHDPRLQ